MAGSLEAFASAAGNRQLARTIAIRPVQRRRRNLVPTVVERLNRVSTGLDWSVSNGRLVATRRASGRMSDFDERMQQLAGPRTQLIPMRLVTRGSEELSDTEGSVLVEVDHANSGDVDVDDLMASDDESFKQHLIHFLTERAHLRRYSSRIGTSRGFGRREFRRAHREGHAAELANLQRELGDPDLTGPEETDRGNTLRKVFTSPRGYTVDHTTTTNPRTHVSTGVFTITAPGGRTFRTIGAWMASPERAAAMRQQPAGARP